MDKADFAEDLKRVILTMDLQPGADLDEAELCARSGLSRTPVRDLLRDLEGQGYVTLRAGKGARVADLSHTMLRDFFLAAPMVYGAILRLAARNATAAQLAALKDAQLAFRGAIREGVPADRALANDRFHRITGEMAGNIYLRPSFERLLIDHARIATTFYRPTNDDEARNLRDASDQHDAMIAAIEAGDEGAAATLADDHWALSRGQIERLVMPPALDLALGADLYRSTA